MKNIAEFALIKTVVTLVRWLPLSLARRFSDGLAWILRDGLNIRTEVVDENLSRAFPGWSGDKREKVSRECYCFYGRAAVDWLKTDAVLRQETVHWEGRERLERMNQEGGIMVTGHLGYWELAGALLAPEVSEFVVYADRQSNPYSEQLIRNIRAEHGVRTVSGSNGVRSLAKLAGDGGVAGFVADQRPRNKPEFVPFFDHLVKNTQIPAFVARHSQKPVYPMVCFRDSDGDITIRFDEPLPASLKQVTRDNQSELLAQFNRWLEETIRQFPHEYFWLHNRWKGARKRENNPATNKGDSS